MKNVMLPLANSWFELLNGNLSYDGQEVKVYLEDADNDDAYHYVLIRTESESDDSNKTSFVTNPIIIIDIVTVHSISVRRSVADNIDNQIRQLVFPNRKSNLPALSGLQITNVIPQSSNYLNEDNGTVRYYRKLTRFIHRITQTN